MNKQIDLRDCPLIREYLDVTNADCQMLCDIRSLTEMLPEVIMASDGSTFDLARVGIEISYVIEHLKEMRDELQKGGAL
ncbi:MAG: hypothetical protein IJ057_09135 [Bacteroidales bacterium]|nr:hypothetical protein [Bacteroidales bacterium]